ncbi:MAG: colanic acid biosynthesis glycosyltransferase WcaL, partial [Geodermatophilaceae bacterium]|nr:colanic acid biosynthesis glycosyltransferase WcaL [Geodermatophilaceae bacterium]
MPVRDPAKRRIGYVLKVYPRFSETFILNEVLALEAAGAQLEIFSLRPPVDGRFHEALAEVRAPVSYIPLHHKAAEVWSTLRAGLAALPALPLALPLLLQLPVDDAAQAVLLADRLRQSGITHLHAHFGSMATSVARAAAELAGVTYSFTAHAKDIFHESVDVEELGRKLGEASVVVTVSDFNVEHLRR